MTLINSVQEYRDTHLSATHTKVASGICAAAAAEMALRTVADVFRIWLGADSQEAFSSMTVNLGGAIFYGLAASNTVPATAMLGATIFTTYSTFETIGSSGYSTDSYLTSELLGKTVRYLLEDVATPICERIWNVAEPALTQIAATLSSLIGLIIPHHPVWIGVTVLSVAALVYNGGLSLLSNS